MTKLRQPHPGRLYSKWGNNKAPKNNRNELHEEPVKDYTTVLVCSLLGVLLIAILYLSDII